MIVEMLGAPGAGKTTLVPSVIEFLSDAGYQAGTIIKHARPFARRTVLGSLLGKTLPGGLRAKALWQVFYWNSYFSRRGFMGSHAELVEMVRKHQAQRPISKADRHHNLYWLYHLMGYYTFLLDHQTPHDAFILDEGFVHRVVQLFASAHEEPNVERIRAYLDLVPRPDLTIHIKCPWEVCKERIYARGLWERFADRSEEEVVSYIANAHSVVGVAADYIRAQGWQLIEIDNHPLPPEEAESELNLALSRLVNWPANLHHSFLVS